jgi:magnesium transporter
MSESQLPDPSDHRHADPGVDPETILHHADTADEAADERIAALIESEAPATELARELEASEPADAADTLETLDSPSSAEVISAMDHDAAAEALAHMELPLAATVIPDLSPEEGARLIAAMAPDDAADLLQALPSSQVDPILRAMPRKIAARLGQLALYHPETAGGIMTTDFLKLLSSSTIAQARDYLRNRREMLSDSDHYTLYCVNEEGQVEGVVDLRTLLLADPDDGISEIMERELEVLRPDLDREEVARAFERYDYLVLPVVDEDRRILGVITVDDVIDIIRAENTEDALKQVGAGPTESVYAPVSQKIKGRLPWLLVNLLTSQVGAVTVLLFTNMIESIALLAVLMGMIANQAGNAGQQSLAVTLRGLVLGEVRPKRVAKLITREMLVGVFSGLITGTLITLAIIAANAAGLIEADWHIGLVAGVAMSGAMVIGCLVGAAIPLIMQRLGIDPATASTIFLTMITDTTSFASLLGLAYLLRGWLLTGAPS